MYRRTEDILKRKNHNATEKDNRYLLKNRRLSFSYQFYLSYMSISLDRDYILTSIFTINRGNISLPSRRRPLTCSWELRRSLREAIRETGENKNAPSPASRARFSRYPGRAQ